MKKTKTNKHLEAEQRKADRAKRSPLEQLLKLDAKFGPGEGAHKERKRLIKQLPEGTSYTPERSI